ncbi:MAG: hypothetical protein OEZ10_12045 [Gammaproteobacteria bacterium]|nr:hypothetical protein [Gammaproteobacteria bacterium]
MKMDHAQVDAALVSTLVIGMVAIVDFWFNLGDQDPRKFYYYFIGFGMLYYASKLLYNRRWYGRWFGREVCGLVSILLTGMVAVADIWLDLADEDPLKTMYYFIGFVMLYIISTIVFAKLWYGD